MRTHLDSSKHTSVLVYTQTEESANIDSSLDIQSTAVPSSNLGLGESRSHCLGYYLLLQGRNALLGADALWDSVMMVVCVFLRSRQWFVLVSSLAVNAKQMSAADGFGRATDLLQVFHDDFSFEWPENQICAMS